MLNISQLKHFKGNYFILTKEFDKLKTEVSSIKNNNNILLFSESSRLFLTNMSIDSKQIFTLIERINLSEAKNRNKILLRNWIDWHHKYIKPYFASISVNDAYYIKLKKMTDNIYNILKYSDHLLTQQVVPTGTVQQFNPTS